MLPMSVLVLGGTREGRELASLLHAADVPVVTSLAGDVTQVRRPEGDVRIGGFGGAEGLADYLRSHAVAAAVDATHPFAAQISANAAAACTAVGVPLLRLSRPSWAQRSDAGSWHWVDSLQQAGTVAAQLGDRVMLATGRQSAAGFAGCSARYVVLRVVDPPEGPLPPGWTVLRARGPFAFDDEVQLLRGHAIEVLVTKDSGGPTSAKLDAAAHLGVAVVVVRRPAPPAGVDCVSTVTDAAAWVTAHSESGG